jgi:HEAT repeat protein
MSSLDLLVSELTSGVDARAEAAALELAECGEAALPALGVMLESTEVDHRWWALRCLAAMSRPRPDWLRRALRDPSPEIRAAAALALGSHPDLSAISDLVEALMDADDMFGSLHVSALLAIGQESVPALLDAFPNSSRRGRIHIMRALAALHDPRTIGAMLSATVEDSAMLNHWASEGLDRLGLNMVYLNPE